MFARIEDGVVRELHAAEDAIEGRFHAALRWVEVTGQEVEEGFVESGEGFVRPAEAAVAAVAPSLASLRAELAALSARIAALS
jgi:hypothetical protein